MQKGHSGQVSAQRSGEYTTPWSSNMRRHLRNTGYILGYILVQRGHVSTQRSGEYTTPWSSNMRRHLRNVHDVNQERVYECNKCKKIQVSVERSYECREVR